MTTALALLTAFVLDLLLGDPHSLPHPVRLMGRLISFCEDSLRELLPPDKKGELLGGILITAEISLLSAGSVWLIIAFSYRASLWLGFAVESVLCYYLLAARSLYTESNAVKLALNSRGLREGRMAVSRIVGRDTSTLEQDGVLRAAVETVAENTCDGVIAPILFIALGGAPLGYFYKAVNTMDSMLGYKNSRYLYFGCAAAKLDDLLNFIPARFSGFLCCLTAGLCGFNAKNAFKIFWRDRKNHASPNSAHTEAAFAGALELQLAGDAYYGGVLCHKPSIGEAIRAIAPYDITRAGRLMLCSSGVALALSIVARVIVVRFLG